MKYAYMMSNRSKTIYTGVTGNLHRRVWEHKHGLASQRRNTQILSAQRARA